MMNLHQQGLFLRAILLGLVAMFASGCGSSQNPPESEDSAQTATSSRPSIVPFAELEKRASGITTWNGRVFVSLPRYGNQEATVYEWIDGELSPFPSMDIQDDITDPSDIVSVNGLRVDESGRLWMVDNATVQMMEQKERAIKVVVWDLAKDEEAFRFHFKEENLAPTAIDAMGDDETAADSDDSSSVPSHIPGFLNDVAVDEQQGVAYFTDSGIFREPALVVYDFVSNTYRRLLTDCPLIQPTENVELVLDGGVVEVGPPSRRGPWQVGANPIALTSDGSLLVGAMSGHMLFRFPTEVLRNLERSSAEMCESASPAWERPITDGVYVDDAGVVWLTNVEDSRVDGYRDGERVAEYQLPESSFPVAITDYEDDLLVVTNQMHRMPVFHGGIERGEPPYVIYRLEGALSDEHASAE
jgi:sugar lactone lactonase YvrE